MNIFILDSDPDVAARYACDKHAVCMPKESCQMLSTVNRLFMAGDYENMVASTHENHPCTIWTRTSKANYDWLFRHFVAQCREYKSRYVRNHQYAYYIDMLSDPPEELPDIGLTPFAMAMPDQYKCKDSVQAYRKYFLREKLRFATWTAPATIPDWVINHLQRGPYERRIQKKHGKRISN